LQDEGWTLSHSDRLSVSKAESTSLELAGLEPHVAQSSLSTQSASIFDDSDIPDMDDDSSEPHDPHSATLGINPNAPNNDLTNGVLYATEPAEQFLRTRSYDISLVYDKYYRTPRVYLFGFDERRQPLTPEKIMQDISADHANKTATLDPHPHTGIVCLSIHPCKHASLMKKLMDQYRENRVGKKDIDVKQYLFFFLKFISTVTPTIDYDYSLSVEI